MNAYENNKGTYESITGADDAYEDIHHPTSKHTNYNKTPDDDFGCLQGTSYCLLKTHGC